MGSTIETCIDLDTGALKAIRIHLAGMPTRTACVIPADEIQIDEKAIRAGCIRHNIYRGGQLIAHIVAITPVYISEAEEYGTDVL